MQKILKQILLILPIILVLLSGCGINQNNIEQNSGNYLFKSYNLSEIAKHNSANDCWLIINKKVYNVTAFINSHPGGKAILQGCGQDATLLFETRPMGSGSPHSQKAINQLSNYYIGELNN